MLSLRRLVSSAKALWSAGTQLNTTLSSAFQPLTSASARFNVSPILSRLYCTPVYDQLEAIHLLGPVIKKR